MHMNTASVTVLELKSESAKLLDLLHEKGEVVGYKKAVIVALSGDLGAGKTTLSQFIAEILGVGEQVTSPTFVIEKIYKTKDVGRFENFVHIDAYRLNDAAELKALRFEEILNSPHTLVFLEWPERVPEALPPSTFKISFESIDENTRKISY